eukprot:scaffold223691_cov34-Tisochrysis_lutea.AAC.1
METLCSTECVRVSSATGSSERRCLSLAELILVSRCLSRLPSRMLMRAAWAPLAGGRGSGAEVGARKRSVEAKKGMSKL